MRALQPALLGRTVAAWLQGGSLLFAVGEAAAALGMWGYAGSRSAPHAGVGWLSECVILLGPDEPAEVPSLPGLMAKSGSRYAVGLPEAAVLALGPLGEVEVWSSVRPRLLLGKAWRSA